MTTWRAWIAFAAVMLACAIAPGCDERANDRLAAGEAGGSGGREASIELWTLALKGRPELEDYVRAQIAAFERSHAGVRVVWVDVPFREVDRKLMAAAAAGRAPDVVNFSDKTYARFVGLGALRDLRDVLPGDPRAVYLPGALSLCEMRAPSDASLRGGASESTPGQTQTLALPWYLTTQAVLANEDLLGKAGMSSASLPRTWAGLRAAARAYRKAVGDDGTYLFSVPLGHESDFLMMLFSDGLRPLTVDAQGRLKSNLLDPVVVAAVREWVELYREGMLPREAATQGVQHLTDLYKRNRLAVINFGPNFLNVIRQESPKVYEATRVGPAITGELGRGHIAVMVLGVTTQSKQPKLAAELAWALSSAESQAALCRIVPVLPSTKATVESDLFAMPTGDRAAKMTAPELKLAQAQSIAAESLKSAVAFTPSLAEWPDMRRAFEDRIKRAMLSGEAVEESLKVVDAEWARILAAGSGGGAGESVLPRRESTGPHGTEDKAAKQQSSKLKAQSSKLKAQSSKLKAQSSKQQIEPGR